MWLLYSQFSKRFFCEHLKICGKAFNVRSTPYLCNTHLSFLASKNPLASQKLSDPNIYLRRYAHNHTVHWSIERIVTITQFGLLPIAFLFPSGIMDYAVVTLLTLHSHWGLEIICVDYIRPTLFGPIIPKIAQSMVYVLSALTYGGLLYLNYSDVGFIQAIKMLWSL